MSMRIAVTKPTKYPVRLSGISPPRYAYVSEQHWNVTRMRNWEMDKSGNVVSGEIRLSEEIIRLTRMRDNLIPVVRGRAIRFADGNRLNCTVENLEVCHMSMVIQLPWSIKRDDELLISKEDEYILHQRMYCNRETVIDDFCAYLSIPRNKLVMLSGPNNLCRQSIFIDNSPRYFNFGGQHLVLDNNDKYEQYGITLLLNYNGHRIPRYIVPIGQVILSLNFDRIVEWDEFAYIGGENDNRISNFRFINHLFPDPVIMKRMSKIDMIVKEIDQHYTNRLPKEYSAFGQLMNLISRIACHLDRIPSSNVKYEQSQVYKYLYVYSVVIRIERIDEMAGKYLPSGVSGLIAAYEGGVTHPADGCEGTLIRQVSNGFRYSWREYDELSVRDQQYYNCILFLYSEFGSAHIRYETGEREILCEKDKEILLKLIPDYAGKKIHPLLAIQNTIDKYQLPAVTDHGMMELLVRIAGKWNKPSMIYECIAIFEGSHKDGWGFGTMVEE